MRRHDGEGRHDPMRRCSMAFHVETVAPSDRHGAPSTGPQSDAGRFETRSVRRYLFLAGDRIAGEVEYQRIIVGILAEIQLAIPCEVIGLQNIMPANRARMILVTSPTATKDMATPA